MADWWDTFTMRAGNMLIGPQMFGAMMPMLTDPDQRQGAQTRQPIMASSGQGWLATHRVAPALASGVKRPAIADDQSAPAPGQIKKGDRATRSETGQTIEWTGKEWIDIKTLKPVKASADPVPLSMPTR